MRLSLISASSSSMSANALVAVIKTEADLTSWAVVDISSTMVFKTFFEAYYSSSDSFCLLQ